MKVEVIMEDAMDFYNGMFYKYSTAGLKSIKFFLKTYQ
jgi:hypothetical protein